MGKLRIAIITFHRVDNPGAVFQAYALQEKLRNITGADVDILDYHSKEIEYSYRCIRWNALNGIHSILSELVTLPIRFLKRQRYALFRQKHLRLSRSVDAKTIDRINTEYDIFVVGSDQVWNPKYATQNPAFLLDYVREDKRKFSYASSFGVTTIPAEYRSMYRTYLSRFESISVREREGVKLLRNEINMGADIFVDPTFLLSAEQWIEFSGINAERKKEAYVLVYLAAFSQTALQFACDIAQTHNLKVIFLNDMLLKKANVAYKRAVSPRTWLQYFCNASIIVTNSFHGVAFSIILNKPFFVERLADTYNVNSRIDNVLSLFGLEDRVINGIKGDGDYPQIDYDRVNQQLRIERARANTFLESITEKIEMV